MLINVHLTFSFTLWICLYTHTHTPQQVNIRLIIYDNVQMIRQLNLATFVGSSGVSKFPSVHVGVCPYSRNNRAEIHIVKHIQPNTNRIWPGF